MAGAFSDWRVIPLGTVSRGIQHSKTGEIVYPPHGESWDTRAATEEVRRRDRADAPPRIKPAACLTCGRVLVKGDGILPPCACRRTVRDHGRATWAAIGLECATTANRLGRRIANEVRARPDDDALVLSMSWEDGAIVDEAFARVDARRRAREAALVAD